MATFADRLRYYREKAGYSQKELAEKIGISIAAYNKYETRGNEPKIDVLIKLAALLNTDVNTLVGFTKDDDLQRITSYLRQANITIISTEKRADDTLIIYEHEDGIRSNACFLSEALEIIEKCQSELENVTSGFLRNRIENEFLENPYLSIPRYEREDFIKWTNEFANVITELSKLPKEQQDEIINEVFAKKNQ